MRILENRIPPPLVTALAGLLMWAVAEQTARSTLPNALQWGMVAILLVSGASVCLAGVLSFRRARTTVNPLKPETASSLVIAGIYHYTRNPMYLGMLLLLLSWSVYLASLWALLLVPFYVLYLNRFQIVPEERALFALFGTAYADYMARVRRWL